MDAKGSVVVLTCSRFDLSASAPTAYESCSSARHDSAVTDRGCGPDASLFEAKMFDRTDSLPMV
jgi:hypothetical protein